MSAQKEFHENFNPEISQENDDNVKLQNKLNSLEITLSELCKANDSLMPLVMITEILPGLARADSYIKSKSQYLNKRDERCAELEINLPGAIETKIDLARKECQMDPKLDSALNQIDRVAKKLISLEEQICEQGRMYERKFREERINLERTVETFLIENQETNKNFDILEQLVDPSSQLHSLLQEIIGEELENTSQEFATIIQKLKKV